jgi:hypothetical protein
MNLPILPLVLNGQIKVANEPKIINFTNPLEDVKIEQIVEEKVENAPFVVIGNACTANMYLNFFSY